VEACKLSVMRRQVGCDVQIAVDHIARHFKAGSFVDYNGFRHLGGNFVNEQIKKASVRYRQLGQER